MERLALKKAEKRYIFRVAVIDLNASVGKILKIFNRDNTGNNSKCPALVLNLSIYLDIHMAIM